MLKRFWNAEPVAIVGFARKVLLLLVAFNVPISEAQNIAILAVLDSALDVYLRSRVSPPAAPPADAK